MTILGIVTIAAVGAAWLIRRSWVQYVLGVAAVFPQTAGLLIGDKGFPLFYLAIAVVAVLSVPRLLMLIARPERTSGDRTLIDLLTVGLVVWAGVISYAGPRIFAGLPVFDPSLGVDVQVGNLTPLAPTVGNMAQWGYLVLAVLFLLTAGRLFPVDRRIAGVLIWATVILAAARLALGAAWPLDLVQTMPGLPYQNGARAAGTFYEPSVLGMYLTAAAGYFGAQLLWRASSRVARASAVAGLVLVAVLFVANGSGTALMGLVLVAALGAVVVFVRLARDRRMRVRPALIAAGLAISAVALTQLPLLLDLTVGAAATKTETSSWIARNASNDRSVGIVLDTFGLGVGLGGNRPSSLPLFVLSCLGILGTALLVVIIVLAIRRGLRAGQITSVWMMLGALTAGAVAVPDLSTPLIWVGIAACAVPALAPVVAQDPIPEAVRHG